MNKNIGAALAGFVVLFGWYHAAEYMILFRNSAGGFLFFQALFFGTAVFISRRQFNRGLSAWGLGAGRWLVRHLAAGLLTGVVLYGATFALSLAFGLEKLEGVPAFSTLAAPLGLFVFGSFFSSLSEDLLTRGYVYAHLKGTLRPHWIVLLSAAVYLLNHIYRLNDGVDPYIYLFLLGILYVIPLVLTRRLWFTAGVHWAGNVTFYLTHELWKTGEVAGAVSANYVLAGVTLLLIPVQYFLLKAFRLMPGKPAAARVTHDDPAGSAGRSRASRPAPGMKVT